MADETQVKDSSAPAASTPASTEHSTTPAEGSSSVSSSTPSMTSPTSTSSGPTPPAGTEPVKGKKSGGMVVFVILALIIGGAGGFFAGRATAPQNAAATPTPTVMQKVVEPTEEVVTPEVSNAMSPSQIVSPTVVAPTTAQNAAPSVMTP